MFPGVSHEEYLDTPVMDVEWMLRIDDAYKAAEAQAQKPAPARPSTPRIT